MSNTARAAMQGGKMMARFGAETIHGVGSSSFYPREGLEDIGVGFLLHLDAALRPDSLFNGLSAMECDWLEVTSTPETRELDPGEMAVMLRPLIQAAHPALPLGLQRQLLQMPVSSEASASPAMLDDMVLLSIDETIFCPPSGAVLIGWCLSQGPAQLELISGGVVTTIDLAACVRLPRPGVIDATGREHGFEDIGCGFIAHVPAGFSRAGPSTLEAVTPGGRSGAMEVPTSRLHGLPAIRSLLADCDMQFGDVAPAMRMFGPAIESLNTARLAHRGRSDVIQFGKPPENPTVTLVIPLHGQIDYAEVQCALFAADPGMDSCEVVYVLDDPSLRRKAENLFAAIHTRTLRPLTLIVHAQNLGFAPACNTGLAAARGRQICFLNSDVFPGAPGWLAALCAWLDADTTLGVVGPVLLHEDGSLQHEGVTFRSLPQHAGWYFGHHSNVGQRPEIAPTLRRWPAITGACMVLNTGQARALGGFDEAYIIGDFEDSDLCLRLRAQGLAAAVDGAVQMVHPGRRSQPSAAERWRMNLILYNASVHDGRWHDVIAAQADDAP